MDLRNFFSRVKSKGMHLANMHVQEYHDREKAEKVQESREELRNQIVFEIERRKAANRKRRIDASNAVVAVDQRTEEQVVQDEIDAVAEDIPDLVVRPSGRVVRQKRPPNWEEIAVEAQIFGNRQALKNYVTAFEGISETAKYQRLNNWKKDVASNRVFLSGTVFRLPSYGTEIDLQLFADCKSTREAGLSIDDVILRRLLKVRLAASGKDGLMRENGGDYDYGHSWAMRFYKRHNLVLRVCTTKMRELPVDFEAKKATYMRIGAELIHRYNVPPELVINGDETEVLLVNRARTTRSAQGVKRVKILGMGDDKAQITTTIFVTESGDVLPYQMIFSGKTVRCHPSSRKPDDCLWTHTESHWQSVKTYLEVIEKIIVPYKNSAIQKLRLPSNQVTILKHDLHFTHKDAAVLKYLKDNFIAPLFVPAACTDAMQECDVVVNKPFKAAVRSGYRDHLDSLFRLHQEKGLPTVEFAPKLTMGALKPFLTGFVQRGILALKTPEMKACIQNAFAVDGCFRAMRSPEMQLIAHLDQAHIVDDSAVIEGVEADENFQELAADSGADTDSDRD